MEKIIMLANSIDGNPPDMENGRTAEDPDVKLLASVINDDEAEAALLCTASPQTVEQIAANAGVDPESIRERIESLAQKGVLLCYEENGEIVYHRVPWAPGIYEHCILNKATQGYEVSKCFDNAMNSGNAMLAGSFPVGRGTLRVIPIAKSVRADQHIATYEEVRTYLDQSDIYSAADCACRLSKRYIGQPCQHTVEGMCIQVGVEADYYIRTGRAHRITREEAEALLLKAEREGLVHQIFNNEGENKSTFICNCCGCSCGSLRATSVFRTPDTNRSNYVAEVDKDKCVACGACVENCNANALRLGDALCESCRDPEPSETPYDTVWGEDKWDKDYRKMRMVGESGTSPCKTKCPAHISIQGYIKKAAQGKYDEALKVIKRDNPFPAVCGRICPRSCESECTRGSVDEALAIDDIKKYIADWDLKAEKRYKPEIFEKHDEKIAVIGAGPAGLSCAYYLAVEGYKVTVFEKEKVLGGMLTMGIPSFRLDKDVISAEIDVIRELGVQFRTGVNIGKDVTLADLRREGFKAFYIAIGAQAGRKLGIEGEDLSGVVSGIDFLRNVALSEKSRLEGRVVVIGGGNVAIDVARTALRLGPASVGMFCLESKSEMPALPEEQEEATGEGVTINNSWGPKRVIGENGKVTGVEFKRCVSVFDENGKFCPKYDENETITVPCEHILVSVGQAMDWGKLLESSKAELTPRRTLNVHPISFQTGEKDVFAGGDAVTGPKFAIDAIAAGKQGAISIHRFVQGRGLTVRREREYHPLDKENINLAGFDRLPRQRTSRVDFNESKRTFKDLRSDLTEEQIKKETQRCLGCGVTVVDQNQCIGCGVCGTKCEFDAIHLVRKYDVESAEPPAQWTQDFSKYMTDRNARLAAKSKS